MTALRRTESEARRTNRQVAAWLNKGVRMLNRLSSWPLGFENFREDVRRWARLYEDEEEERRKWVPLTSIQHAEAKRVAAEAALHLCDEFAIKPTTTKDGAFCALAAVGRRDGRSAKTLYRGACARLPHISREAKRRIGTKIVRVR